MGLVSYLFRYLGPRYDDDVVDDVVVVVIVGDDEDDVDSTRIDCGGGVDGCFV